MIINILKFRQFILKLFMLTLGVFVSLNFVVAGAQAFECGEGAVCCYRRLINYQHPAQREPFHKSYDCAAQLHGIPCDLEGAGVPDRASSALLNTRGITPDASAAILAEVTPASLLNPAGFSYPRRSIILYTPIYLQNLSFRC